MNARILWCSAALLLVAGAVSPATVAASELYQAHCAACHGADRFGVTGPALLPESLKRLRREKAVKAIAEGRAATQMAAFGETLNADQIAELVDYIYSPPEVSPRWTPEDMAESHIVNVEHVDQAAKPVFSADPLNLFVVVESGDHHATILDGDTFEPIHRFQTRYALHGGPKFTRDGRFVFFGSRDGWITKFDLYTFQVIAEIRAGINTRNIALSRDSDFVAVANYLPHTLVLLNASDLSVAKVFDVADKDNVSSRVSAVYQAPTRNSFIAALKDIPEVWEIATDPNAPPVYTGLVHSHEKGMVEALAADSGLFALRRIAVEAPIDDFFFDQNYRHLMGSSRDGTQGVVVNLNVGRPIATIDLPGLPHLGSGITWTYQGRPVMATPHLREARLSVIDMTDWSVLKTIETMGPGFFMRSHEASNYAWTDVFFGPNKDVLHVIDKRTLEIVKTLKPEPGKTAAHVEFTRDGSHALVSIWDMEGALVVYDAKTLEEVKRIPMVKPSGKYNVYNKITFSAGTSH